jgi:hypothetical protein
MKKRLFGMYHIRKMDKWNEDYINVDGQVFIWIGSDEIGNLHFGYLRWYLYCK